EDDRLGVDPLLAIGDLRDAGHDHLGGAVADREVVREVLGDLIALVLGLERLEGEVAGQDRKSTRLNSSHVKISYAVFCLKKQGCRDRTGTRAAPAPAPRRREAPWRRSVHRWSAPDSGRPASKERTRVLPRCRRTPSSPAFRCG